MFDDKIHTMEIATLFTQLTKDKKRRNMGLECFRIWARMFLKKVIKPEYYILVATNISDMEMNTENRKYFGRIVDEVFDLLDKGDGVVDKGSKIDQIIKKHLSMLLRKCFMFCVLHLLPPDSQLGIMKVT